MRLLEIHEPTFTIISREVPELKKNTDGAKAYLDNASELA